MGADENPYGETASEEVLEAVKQGVARVLETA